MIVETSIKENIKGKILLLRKLLGMNQTEFCKELMISRSTLFNIENPKSNKMLSLDTAFRLYYITSKLKENKNQGKYIQDLANDLNIQVEEEVIKYFYNLEK